MPDITMCTNKRCLKRFDCYRYMAVPGGYQSHSPFEKCKINNYNMFFEMYGGEMLNDKRVNERNGRKVSRDIEFKKWCDRQLDMNDVWDDLKTCFDRENELIDENEKLKKGNNRFEIFLNSWCNVIIADKESFYGRLITKFQDDARRLLSNGGEL